VNSVIELTVYTFTLFLVARCKLKLNTVTELLSQNSSISIKVREKFTIFNMAHLPMKSSLR